MPKYFWLLDQHNEELMKNHNEDFSFIQVHDTFIHFLFFYELIVLEMSPERFRPSSVVWQTALTPTNLNLDICSLIVPAPEMNYRPFCHSGERRDQTRQTRHVAALGMSGQRHHTVTLRDFRYSQYNPDVSWVTSEVRRTAHEANLTFLDPRKANSQVTVWLSKRADRETFLKVHISQTLYRDS